MLYILLSSHASPPQPPTHPSTLPPTISPFTLKRRRLPEIVPGLALVQTSSGVHWYSGADASPLWSVPEHSQLVSYCASYDLCTLSYVFDSTPSDLLGKSIDFMGPLDRSPPWTFTIDMGMSRTFTHWRMAGNTHYSFGQAYLNYIDSDGATVKAAGSDVTYNRSVGGFASAVFTDYNATLSTTT